MNFFGLYRGICTQNVDPAKLYRIRLSIPQVLGKAESAWASPCFMPGWPTPFPVHTTHTAHVFTDNDTGDNAGGSATETLTHTAHTAHTATKAVPAIGEPTWVMFESGDVNKPVWMGVWKTNG